MRHVRRALGFALTIGLTVAAVTVAAYQWSRTADMTLEEAIALAGQDLDPDKQHLIAAALRRRALIAVRAIRRLSQVASGPAIAECENALAQVHAESK